MKSLFFLLFFEVWLFERDSVSFEWSRSKIIWLTNRMELVNQIWVLILSINHKDHPVYEISGSENHKKKYEVGFKEVINIDYCVIQYIFVVKSLRRSGPPPGALAA